MIFATTCHDASSPPDAMPLPLDEISFSTPKSVGSQMKEKSDNDSLVSEVSDEEVPQQTSKMVDTVPPPPRTIFASYYKANPTATRSANPPTKRIQRLPQPQNNDAFPDPYEYFGIERPERLVRPRKNTACDASLNSYERILQQHETTTTTSSPSHHRTGRPPFWMNFFPQHASESHLHRSSSSSAPPHHSSRNALSDTELIRQPQKSCLRRGRFSASGSNRDAPPASHAVCFQPKIEVRVFERPVEQFAARGWSDYFG